MRRRDGHPPPFNNFRQDGLAGIIANICRLVPSDGFSFSNLEGSNLLKTAFQQTGLDDLGDDFSAHAFELLLESFRSDAELNLVGRICARNYVLGLLRNRLLMTEDRKRHPEIDGETIGRPVFITGLPRTGSTLLHGLLAADVRSRSPLVWEVMYPSPPPKKSSYRCDPRISRTERELKWLNILMPRFKVSHIINAALPQECIAITAHSFMSPAFESMFFVHSFRRWLDGLDKRPSYAFHRHFLQHLQWQCPGSHWILKAPSHLFTLDALFQVYPDAFIVMTHRDPAKVVASCASFTEILRSPFVNFLDRKKLGVEITTHWEKGARKAIQFRENRPDLRGRFFDVSYPDLLSNPMEVVRQIYERFDIPLSTESRKGMLNFLAQNPQNKNGVHLYSLQDYGLDLQSERERFGFYTNHFGMRSESRRMPADR